MEKSGPIDWKWSEVKDEIAYRPEDGVSLIKEPQKRTLGGTYLVPHIVAFKDFFVIFVFLFKKRYLPTRFYNLIKIIVRVSHS